MEVAILAEAAAFPADAPEWGRGAAATGPAATGMDEIGAVVIGMVAIGTANGGMATDGAIRGPTLSSSVISAFRGPGVGVGEAILITAMDIRTVTMDTVMATRTAMEATGTVTTGTGTVMDMATATKVSTALPRARE